jgi:hypothetical protein
LTNHLADRNARPIALSISLAYDKAMKRIILIAIALAVIGSENGYAGDKMEFDIIGLYTCSEYLEGYSRTTLHGDTGYSGPENPYNSWIAGYLSGFNIYVRNANGKRSILGNMTINEAYKWVASWCRDNPSRELVFGVGALIKTLSKN